MQIVRHLCEWLSTQRMQCAKLDADEIAQLLSDNPPPLLEAEVTVELVGYHPLATYKSTPSAALASTLANLPQYVPKPYQTELIDNAMAHFAKNEKGVLIIPCGSGKTLISLWIAKALTPVDTTTAEESHVPKISTSMLIAVPNLLLLNQWHTVISALFASMPYQLVASNVNVSDIVQFLNSNSTRCIVITTYASSHKVASACKQLKYKFQMKILDEMHHVTSPDKRNVLNTKKFIQILNVPSMKQLSLTATLKTLHHTLNLIMQPTAADESSALAPATDADVISNDNVEYFGAVIAQRSVLWAITSGVICDYALQFITTDSVELEQKLAKFHVTTDDDKRMFLGAYTALLSISGGHTHHLLVYANSKDNTKKIVTYVGLLLKNDYFPSLSAPITALKVAPAAAAAVVETQQPFYYARYHGDMSACDQNVILHNFRNAKTGIIACVYCLGEGWDFPKLDGVVFTENMTSNIRIVQSMLRPCRLYAEKPTKIAKIVIPVLFTDMDISTDYCPDFDKVKMVIKHLGSEDETLPQKIKAYRITIDKQDAAAARRLAAAEAAAARMLAAEQCDRFGEFDDELTRQLRLKTISREAFGMSYSRAKLLLAPYNIRSKTTYRIFCEKNGRFSKNPKEDYGKQFLGWVDYLSIPQVYYTKEEWIDKIRDYVNSDSKLIELIGTMRMFGSVNVDTVCRELCRMDAMFPHYEVWADYYEGASIGDIIYNSACTRQSLFYA
jgi:predicted helicase